MKILKRIILIFFLLISAIPLICDAADTIDVKDMTGRHVKARFNPDRILCLGPGTLRLIVYLQAETKVAGVEDMEKMSPAGRPYWIASPKLHNLPVCGPGGPSSIGRKPDLERVLSLKPDVIFTTFMEGKMADDIQRILGIPVIVLSYGESSTFDETMYDSLFLAGKILNKEKRAENIIEYIESLRKDLNIRTENIPDNKKPSVYAGGIGYRGSHGIESSERNYIPFKWLNADNIAEKVRGTAGSHVFMDKEMLLKLNPEFIFIDRGGMDLIKDDHRKRPEFYHALDAFSKGRVYSLLPFNWYATNAGTALADAYATGKIIYPDPFKDIDPEAKADEIYTFLLGTPVYSAMKKDYGKIGEKIDFK